MSALHDLVRALPEGATLEIHRYEEGTTGTAALFDLAVRLPDLSRRIVGTLRMSNVTRSHSAFEDIEVDNAAAALVESLEHLA